MVACSVRWRSWAQARPTEPLAETSSDVRRRLRPDPRRCQLDHEGDPIETTADLDHRPSVAHVQHEAAAARRGTLDEEQHRVRRPGLRHLGVGVGDCERSHAVGGLTDDAQLLAGGRNDNGFWPGPEDRLNQRSCGVEMLAVVSTMSIRRSPR